VHLLSRYVGLSPVSFRQYQDYLVDDAVQVLTVILDIEQKKRFKGSYHDLTEINCKQLKKITFSNFNRYSDRPVFICLNNNQGDKKLHVLPII
jgi:hypothetical protein